MAKTQQKGTGAAKVGKNKKFKKRERKNVPYGLVFIQASFNNTIVTITDQTGNTLSWKSLRLAWLPRLPQGNPVRGAAGSGSQRCGRARSRSSARSMSASQAPAPAANPPSARSLPPALMFGPFATSRRCRTTAAVRRSAAECKAGIRAQD